MNERRMVFEILGVIAIGIIIISLSVFAIAHYRADAVKPHNKSTITIDTQLLQPQEKLEEDKKPLQHVSKKTHSITSRDDGAQKEKCPPCPQPSQECDKYIIEQGDTLSALSSQWGKSVDDIAHKNNIDNKDLIYRGSSLCR